MNGRLLALGGLVGGFVGQTALKTAAVLQEALGGVLFIDEAYALGARGSQDYGSEAIETLLKAMEDHRHELVVILAGYPRKMDELFETNPGLKSRFNRYLHFEDYCPSELEAVFETFCRKTGFVLAPGAGTRIQQCLSSAYSSRDEKFGNARLARNMFERASSSQANRIVALPSISNDTLVRIEPAISKDPLLKPTVALEDGRGAV